MLLPNSRYKTASAFQPADAAGGVFRGCRVRPIGPAVGVIEHVMCEGDRLDLLARHYYNDDRLWWRILDANPQITFGGDLMPVEDLRPDDTNKANGADDGDDTEGTDSDVPGHAEDSLVGRIILIPRAQETSS